MEMARGWRVQGHQEETCGTPQPAFSSGMMLPGNTFLQLLHEWLLARPAGYLHTHQRSFPVGNLPGEQI